RVLDRAVAAIRSGDANGAIALAESPPLQSWFKLDRSVFASLLAVMLRDRLLLDYVEEKLRQDPALGKARYSGRTLLHAAAAAGPRPTAELRLRLGRVRNALDAGGHTRLFPAGTGG